MESSKVSVKQKNSSSADQTRSNTWNSGRGKEKKPRRQSWCPVDKPCRHCKDYLGGGNLRQACMKRPKDLKRGRKKVVKENKTVQNPPVTASSTTIPTPTTTTTTSTITTTTTVTPTPSISSTTLLKEQFIGGLFDHDFEISNKQISNQDIPNSPSSPNKKRKIEGSPFFTEVNETCLEPAEFLEIPSSSEEFLSETAEDQSPLFPPVTESDLPPLESSFQVELFEDINNLLHPTFEKEILNFLSV